MWLYSDIFSTIAYMSVQSSFVPPHFRSRQQTHTSAFTIWRTRAKLSVPRLPLPSTAHYTPVIRSKQFFYLFFPRPLRPKHLRQQVFGCLALHLIFTQSDWTSTCKHFNSYTPLLTSSPPLPLSPPVFCCNLVVINSHNRFASLLLHLLELCFQFIHFLHSRPRWFEPTPWLTTKRAIRRWRQLRFTHLFLWWTRRQNTVLQKYCLHFQIIVRQGQTV